MKKYAVPFQIIQLLSSGEFYSGEQLGDMFGMTRVAVNKHIRTIRGWGLDVCAVQGRGYRLMQSVDLLDEAKLRAALPDHRIQVIPIIDSTNQYLLDRVSQLQSGDICLTEYQTAGRGRRGRRWFSPFGVNFYYSMHWKLQPGTNLMGLSLLIGVIVAELLRDYGANDVKVKWPNDIYIDGKKLAGILVELCGASHDGMHAVMGIGINLGMKQPDESIVTQAWSNLENVTISRNALVIALTQRLTIAIKQFEAQGLAPFVPRWFALDNFLNRPVKLLLGDEIIRGISRGIDVQGALMLEKNGEILTFISGDISLRSDELFFEQLK